MKQVTKVPGSIKIPSHYKKECICLKCGFKCTVKRERPCRLVTCPKCGNKMAKFYYY